MNEDNMMDKMKDGLEKAKDFAADAAKNIKEKIHEGKEKLFDMKDDAIDKTKTAGQKLNEQLCKNLEGTDDEKKMKIQEEFCNRKLNDMDNEHIIVKEEYVEYTEILPNDKELTDDKKAA